MNENKNFKDSVFNRLFCDPDLRLPSDEQRSKSRNFTTNHTNTHELLLRSLLLKTKKSLITGEVQTVTLVVARRVESGTFR